MLARCVSDTVAYNPYSNLNGGDLHLKGHDKSLRSLRSEEQVEIFIKGFGPAKMDF